MTEPEKQQAFPSVAIGAALPPSTFVFGPDLLTIHPDGTVEGRLEDMGEAARLFVEYVRTQIRLDPTDDAREDAADVEAYEAAKAADDGTRISFDELEPGTGQHND